MADIILNTIHCDYEIVTEDYLRTHRFTVKPRTFQIGFFDPVPDEVALCSEITGDSLLMICIGSITDKNDNTFLQYVASPFRANTGNILLRIPLK